MITGSATVGAMLTCSNGTWANFPQSFAYAWLRDGTPIAAAGDTHIVSSADVGHRVACQVTATNQTGSVSAPSAPLSIPDGGSGAPRLSGLAVHPNTFVAALSGASIAKAAASGATVSYSDSVAAATTFTVLRSMPGVTRGRSCLAPRRGARHPRACTRWLALGRFSRKDVAGANRFHFTGRLNRSALRPGSYRLAASAAVGRSVSVTEHAGFVIKPRRRAR